MPVSGWIILFNGIVGFCGAVGLLALISPRAFTIVSAYGNRVLSGGREARTQERWFNIDEIVLSHGRLFGAGVCCTAMYLWLISHHGPDVYSKAVLLPIVGVSLVMGLAALRHIIWQKRTIDLQAISAETDVLTGLANRRVFNVEVSRRLAERQRRGCSLSVMIVDIDNFKTVNDTYGHLHGDAILQQVAKVMEQNARGPDLVARLGGDEFTVILVDTDLHHASFAADRLCNAIGKGSFQHAGQEIPVTISIGVAEAEADDEVSTLLKRADSALYAAKDSGKNCCFRQGGPERTDAGQSIPIELES